MSNIVQYIIVNAAIHRQLHWPLGAVIAQCCHATAAVGHIYADDEETKSYFSNIDGMRKIVLEIENEDELRKLSELLDANDIKHKLWIEMPENIATCISAKPYTKKTVEKYFKKYKLFQ